MKKSAPRSQGDSGRSVGAAAGRPFVLVLCLAWLALVVGFFALRHPVRDGSLWLTHVGGVCCNLLLLLAAIGLGLRVLSWLGLSPKGPGEQILLSLGVGFLVLTYLVLGIGLAGALYPWLGWILVLASVAVGLGDLGSLFVRIRDRIAEPGVVRLGSGALLLFHLPIAATTLWLALAPASAHDALVYHLNLPLHYAALHRIAPLPLNVYSRMPHNLEILTTLAYLLGGEPSARVIDFFMRMAVCAGIYVLARRFLSPAGSLLASLLFLLNPVTTSARTVGNVDLGMAFFFVVAVVAALDAREQRGRGLLWLALLLAGYLMGCKYTGLFFSLAILVFLAAGRPRLRARDWLIGLALLAAPVVPWLIRNAATTGNPVYPLLPSVFPSREWSVALGGQLTHWQQSMGMGRGLADYFLLPWNVAVEGQMGRNYAFFDGILSPLPLAFVPLLILMKNRRPWLMLLALCVIPFIGWAATSQQLRFLIPFLPLTSVATAGVVWSFDRDVLGSKKNRVRALGIACALGFLVIFQLPMLARNAGERVPVVTGVVSKDDYLAEAVQPYAAIRRANELVPRGAKVLMIWENRGYYLERPYLADSFFEASQVAARAAASGSPDGFADGLRADGVTHVIYNHGLGRYFQQLYGPQYIAFLDRFVADHLEPLYSERDVTLYRLK